MYLIIIFNIEFHGNIMEKKVKDALPSCWVVNFRSDPRKISDSCRKTCTRTDSVVCCAQLPEKM